MDSEASFDMEKIVEICHLPDLSHAEFYQQLRKQNVAIPKRALIDFVPLIRTVCIQILPKLIQHEISYLCTTLIPLFPITKLPLVANCNWLANRLSLRAYSRVHAIAISLFYGQRTDEYRALIVKFEPDLKGFEFDVVGEMLWIVERPDQIANTSAALVYGQSLEKDAPNEPPIEPLPPRQLPSIDDICSDENTTRGQQQTASLARPSEPALEHL